MKNLLRLQELDLRIESCKAREAEIPKQKDKFAVQEKRIAAGIEERDASLKKLMVEQKECEGEIEQKQLQVEKYEQQMFAIKENDQLRALLQEIDFAKKQISQKEERVISLMLEIDESKVLLAEAKKRAENEVADIKRQCSEIDAELAEKTRERREMEGQRGGLEALVDKGLLLRYTRIRNKRAGAAAVFLRGESCSGCHMRVTPQIVNEVLAGDKTHSCSHCGRLLFEKSNFEDPVVPQQ